LKPQNVADALNMSMTLDRVLDGPESGTSYDRVVEYLDRIERDGYFNPVAHAPLTFEQKVAAADEAFLAPQRARQEADARLKAWQAEERERILVARAEATARYLQAGLDRITHGMDLREQREQAGLGLAEVAALIGTVDASMLLRLEAGKPLGCKLDAIEAIYRTLPKFSGKPRKVVAK
jgi:hypothetical protein